MINSILALAAVAAGASLVGLFGLAARWRRLSAGTWFGYVGVLIGIAVVAGTRLWDLPRSHVVAGAVGIFLSVFLVSSRRPQWNPPGAAFLGTVTLTCLAFVLRAIGYSLSGEMGPGASAAGLALAVVEAFALLLLLFGIHEVVDVLARTKWNRRAGPVAVPDPAPFVSVQVAAHNEPPELVIESLRTLRNLDYPSYEVVVLDNNTEDDSLWRPVEAFCEEAGFRFVRLVDWPGFKAGALNHGLEICDPRTEILAYVDADFSVEPGFLRDTVGHFSDGSVAIVQTAQDFRIDAERESEYLRRLALTYKAFDEVTMPSRNERNAIIFAGTMGLIRRSALEKVGGFSEWCVTEDAETSLRLLAHGYSGIYVERIYGRGVMPLTFAALKKQRFRWCFGGVQLLKRHWRLLATGRSRAEDGSDLRLTRAQRFDYLSGGLQWFQGLLTFLFALLLLAGIAFEYLGLDFQLRPLVGVFVVVPLLLLVTGVTKSLWGLRVRLSTSWADAIAVVAIWIALSWAVTLAATQALFGKRMAFLRTPKFHENESIRQAFLTTRVETPLALAMVVGSVAGFAMAPAGEGLFVGILCAWGAAVYGTAPITALAAARIRLRSTALRRRRALEETGPRSYRRPVVYGFATAIIVAFLLTTGSSLVEDEGAGLDGLFAIPDASEAEKEDGDDRRRKPDRANQRVVPAPPSSDTPVQDTRFAAGGGTRDAVPQGPSARAGTRSGDPQSEKTVPNNAAPQATEEHEPNPRSTDKPEQPTRPAPQSTPQSRPDPQGTPRSDNGRSNR